MTVCSLELSEQWVHEGSKFLDSFIAMMGTPHAKSICCDYQHGEMYCLVSKTVDLIGPFLQSTFAILKIPNECKQPQPR